LVGLTTELNDKLEISRKRGMSQMDRRMQIGYQDRYLACAFHDLAAVVH